MSQDWVQLLKYLPLLVLSAALEVGGDTGMRFGLKGQKIGFLFGAFSLIAYGLVVNIPKWDFGRLLGVYIAIFFVVSQVISVAAFHEKITTPTLVGGSLILAGGAVLTFWTPK